MCVNFTTVTRDQLVTRFDAPILGDPAWFPEAWQDYGAPIIRHNRAGRRVSSLANYGMVPKSQLPAGVRFTTMNCRDDSLSTKKSFAEFWKAGQLALVPLQDFFEPSWETGKAIRHRIGLTSGEPFAVAGIWRSWVDMESGLVYPAFSQITINADGHPLMSRFHRPEDEKRSLVIIPEAEYDNWLSCKNPEIARTFLKLFPSELMRAEPAPVAPRKKKAIDDTLSLI